MDDWPADPVGAFSIADARDPKWSYWMGNHDLPSWESECDSDQPTVDGRTESAVPEFIWRATDIELDIDSVVGYGLAKQGNAYRELLWNSIDGLESSNLSRLFRVVRDWSADSAGEEESRLQFAREEPVEILEPVESVEFEGSFLTHLIEGNHELLEREAGKDRWAWFCDWRDIVLALAERFQSLSGDEVVALLKRALASRRSVRRVRAPQERQAPAEQLLRLAVSIVPNAPPIPPHVEALPIGAG